MKASAVSEAAKQVDRRTPIALEGLTDEGQFEVIATAVLRIAEAKYAGLSQPGINAAGRTRKSPVDAVCYAPGDPNHMIVAHHTIAADLRPKWLLDPAAVKQRPRSRTRPVAGDVVKTVELAKVRRARNPDLKVTLVLTCNREISEDLLTDATACAAHGGITVDFWPASRLAHSLDTLPDGQWVRRQQLGIEQERLSAGLLAELSARSVSRFNAGDDPDRRIARSFEQTLLLDTRPLVLVAAASGQGKTVACHRALASHVDSGGYGLIVAHEHLENASSLEQAVFAALKDLEPSLTPLDSITGLIADDCPLMVLVEDVSRSREPGRLIEKLLSWTDRPAAEGQVPRSGIRVLCPVWPSVLSRTSAAFERQRAAAVIRIPPMSTAEGREAVESAARRDGAVLSRNRMEAIARSLGSDPLMIGLNRDWRDIDPAKVIARYVEGAAQRAANGSHIGAQEIIRSLGGVAREMIRRRALSPTWSQISSWSTIELGDLRAIQALIDQGDVLRLENASDGALRFRHDRVRAWLLTQAAVGLLAADEMSEELIADPAYAEIIAGALGSADLDGMVERVARQNPLALFLALGSGHLFAATRLEEIASAAMDWLSTEEARGAAYEHLRWEAMLALEGAEGSFVSALVDAFPAPNSAALLAKLRNGDVEGGLRICEKRGLHAASHWLPDAIVMAREAKGEAFVREVGSALVQSPADGRRRAGLLILAGVIGCPTLLDPLQTLWSRDEDRRGHLASYLWAFARCAVPDRAAQVLDPVCALWATLPAPERYEPDRNETTIYDLASDDVRFGFNRLPPSGALNYFFQRAESSDLSWPIQYMLHDLDEPGVVAWVVDVLADLRRSSPTGYSTSSLRSLHWRYQFDDGWQPMRAESRAVLRMIWSDGQADEHRRVAAFDWWSSSRDPRDMPLLRALSLDELLAERALRKRLERGDVSAHPALVQQLFGSEAPHWWHYLRYAWSPVLSAAFDDLLRSLRKKPEQLYAHNSDLPHAIAEAFLVMPLKEAERTLLDHWPTLKASPWLVQIALYIGTPELHRLAAAVIAAHDRPASLFEHLTSHWGVRTNGHVGVTHEDQIIGLAPYLYLLDEQELSRLADCCNEKGWFATRRRLLDPVMPLARDPRTQDELQAAFTEWSGMRIPIDFSLERCLNTGLQPGEIVEALFRWLPQNPAREALDVASQVLRLVGARADVERLSSWRGDDSQHFSETMADTYFAVARRVG